MKLDADGNLRTLVTMHKHVWLGGVCMQACSEFQM